VVILLILTVVGGSWWFNTRNMDFLTPPSSTQLEKVRIKVESSLPQVDRVDDAISEPPALPVPETPLPPILETKIPVEIGNLTEPVVLKSYADIAPRGSAYLAELAAALEEQSELRRALLVWERVLDVTHPDDTQTSAAITAIKRLRPPLPIWNSSPQDAIPVTLQASTSKKNIKSLVPVLDEVARDLERASSGIIKVKTIVLAGKSSTKARSPSPIALWLSGPDPKSSRTAVYSFTVQPPKTLRQEILKSVFLLVCGQLGRQKIYSVPPPLLNQQDPLDALNSHITRLAWSEFATSVNLPIKKLSSAKISP
jgi:hypothetical protein